MMSYVPAPKQKNTKAIEHETVRIEKSPFEEALNLMMKY